VFATAGLIPEGYHLSISHPERLHMGAMGVFPANSP